MTLPLPEYGVYSHATLMLNQDAVGESRAAYLKRAAVLFEHLLLIAEGFPVGGVDSMISKRQWLARVAQVNDPLLLSQLERIFLVDYEVLGDREELYAKLDEHDDEDLWLSPHGDEFVSWVENRRPTPQWEGDEREYHKFLVGYISSDWRLVRNLQANFDACTGLLTPLHAEAVQHVYGQEPADEVDLVRRSTAALNFDFSTLSWADLILLRESGFAQDYRTKIADWASRADGSNEMEDLHREISESVERAVIEVLSASAPTPIRTSLGAIGGLLPVLNLAVNPLSIFTGVRDSLREHRLKNHYGWLFFINEARQISLRGHRVEER